MKLKAPGDENAPYGRILGRLEVTLGAVVAGAGLLLLVSVAAGPATSPSVDWSSRIGLSAVLAGLFALAFPGWALLRGKWWPQLFPALYVVLMLILRSMSQLTP